MPLLLRQMPHIIIFIAFILIYFITDHCHCADDARIADIDYAIISLLAIDIGHSAIIDFINITPTL
jgi:hypothetical protein